MSHADRDGGDVRAAAVAISQRALAVPLRSYVICTTPRTGSYLLCEALKSTGIAGNPNEYLSGAYQQYWASRWGTHEYPAYLRRVRRLATTPNGVCGVKVHSVQLEHFLRQVARKPMVPIGERREILERWFPGPRYVWLRRENRLRQAISYARAVQTKVWWDTDQPPAPYDRPRLEALTFDRGLIDRSVRQLEQGDDAWRQYFELHGLEPLVVSYEQMIGDLHVTLRRLMVHIGLDLPNSFRVPPSRFRPQSDATTEDWLDRYQGRIADADHSSTARAQPALRPTSSSTANGSLAGELAPILSSRRWQSCSVPFRHIRAEDVFVPEMYEWMAAEFRQRLAAGRFARDMPGYDASAMAVTVDDAGAFSTFVSPPWRDLMARLLAPDSTREVNVTLHHHEPASLSGVPHNDLNPGWFVDEHRRSDISVADPAACSYRSGQSRGNRPVVERIRSVAIIYYLANPNGHRGYSGATGLYEFGSDPVDRPVAIVPPRNNSLVAFECTPFSFHSFITNPSIDRNCVVMWLHRRKEEVVRRWGAHSIVEW